MHLINIRKLCAINRAKVIEEMKRLKETNA